MDLGALAPQPLPVYMAIAAAGFALAGGLIAATRFTVAWAPYRTWLPLLALLFGALWLGTWAWALLVTLVSILSFKEFARATGLYREIVFVLLVYAAIGLVNLWAYFGLYGLFMATPVWAIAALTLVPIVLNRTEGMLQWSALSIVGLVYFGWFMGHLTYLATSGSGLGYVLFVVLATQLNDVLGFVLGKRFGRRRWTALSPNKTVEGSVGALAVTIALAFANWGVAFPHLPWWGVLAAGVIVGAGGQIGDLTMANVKRNVGIKDFGDILPGHGGVLDRVNSLTFVAPVFFHFMRFFFGGFG